MDNYHIYERIGKGMHSEVFKGRKKKTIEYYAIKSVHLSQKRRVHQEVKTIHGLDHPNILKFYNWYETHNHLWLILEYCVGGDLKSLLQQDLCLPVESVHDFGRDLLAATQHLHSKGIIHCDLKPTNVLLDENGSIRLGGFGCARKLAEISERPLVDLPPAARGTPAYMAPELFQPGAAQSTASDLWALGCIFYECFTGRAPFVNPSFHELVRCILNTDPAPMRGDDPQFTNLVGRLLDKNPATRMSWMEMLTHPFWQFGLSPLQMPDEPALLQYIERHNLAPRLAVNATGVSRAEDCKAAARARIVRESVDITRLSQMVKGNLVGQVGQENTDFDTGDVNLAHADVEVDFHTQQPEGTDAADQDAPRAVLDEVQPAPAMHHSVQAGEERAACGLHPAPCNIGNYGKVTPQAPAELDKSRHVPDIVMPNIACRALQLHGSAVETRRSSRLSTLVFHRLDLIVRPLVGNRRIENWNDARWNAARLPPGVAQWTKDRIMKLEGKRTPELEGLITTLSSSLRNPSSPPALMCNLLAFLEMLAAQDCAAQALVNSPLTACLVLLLQHEVAMLRMRAATVLGILIRFATTIEVDLLRPAIDELRKRVLDEDVMVRRRAMVTLGELLFYMCSVDSSDTGAGLGGTSVRAAVDAIVRLLHPEEDAVTQQYACKAIDNVLATGGFLPQQFADAGTVQGLLKLLGESTEEAVQTAACSAFGRVLRFCPSLVPAVALPAGYTLCRFLEAGDPRLQVNTLNALNIILVHMPLQDQYAAPFLSDRHVLLQAVSFLSDNQACVRVQPKALLTCALLMRLGPQWLCAGVEADMLGRIEVAAGKLETGKFSGGSGSESLDRDLEVYTSDCRDAVVEVVCEVVAELLEEIVGSISTSSDEVAAKLIACFMSLTKTPLTRKQIASRVVISAVGDCVRALWAGDTSSSRQNEMTRTSELLQAVLETLVQPQDLLLELGDAFVELLLPALCTVAYKVVAASCDSEGVPWDARVNAARMLTEIVMFYVSRHDMYRCCGSTGVAIMPCSKGPADVTKQLDDLLTVHIAPLLQHMMLNGCDPMPLYAQKVLATLLPRNTAFVEAVAKHNMVHRFFEYLSINSPNNNVHNIRVCRILIATSVVPCRTLRELQIPDKVAMVLAYAHENQVDAFLEPAVELCLSLLERELSEGRCHVDSSVPDQRVSTGANTALAGNVLSHIVFCGQGGSALAFLAADCLLMLSQMYVNECRQDLLSGDGLAFLMEALCGSGGPQCLPHTDTPVHVLHSLLESLYLCGSVGKSTAPAGIISDLHLVVGHLAGHRDGKVKWWAQKVAVMFD